MWISKLAKITMKLSKNIERIVMDLTGRNGFLSSFLFLFFKFSASGITWQLNGAEKDLKISIRGFA